MTRVVLVSSSLSLHCSKTVNHPDTWNDWSVLNYSLRYTYLRPHPHTCVEYGRLNQTGRINKSNSSFVVSSPWRIKSMRFANILLRGRGNIIYHQPCHDLPWDSKILSCKSACILGCQHINEVVSCPNYRTAISTWSITPHWHTETVLPEELKWASILIQFICSPTFIFFASSTRDDLQVAK